MVGNEETIWITIFNPVERKTNTGLLTTLEQQSAANGRVLLTNLFPSRWKSYFLVPLSVVMSIRTSGSNFRLKLNCLCECESNGLFVVMSLDVGFCVVVVLFR